MALPVLLSRPHPLSRPLPRRAGASAATLRSRPSNGAPPHCSSCSSSSSAVKLASSRQKCLPHLVTRRAKQEAAAQQKANANNNSSNNNVRASSLDVARSTSLSSHASITSVPITSVGSPPASWVRPWERPCPARSCLPGASHHRVSHVCGPAACFADTPRGEQCGGRVVQAPGRGRAQHAARGLVGQDRRRCARLHSKGHAAPSAHLALEA